MISARPYPFVGKMTSTHPCRHYPNPLMKRAERFSRWYLCPLCNLAWLDTWND